MSEIAKPSSYYEDSSTASSIFPMLKGDDLSTIKYITCLSLTVMTLLASGLRECCKPVPRSLPCSVFRVVGSSRKPAPIFVCFQVVRKQSTGRRSQRRFSDSFSAVRKGQPKDPTDSSSCLICSTCSNCSTCSIRSPSSTCPPAHLPNLLNLLLNLLLIFFFFFLFANL